MVLQLTAQTVTSSPPGAKWARITIHGQLHGDLRLGAQTQKMESGFEFLCFGIAAARGVGGSKTALRLI